MKEYLYGLRQRTGRAPVIKKLGAVKPGMEQTPFIYKGELYFAESQGADDVCPVQYIRIRNEKTGQVSAPFGLNRYFASAYATDEAVYVFATSLRDDKPMTMYESEDAGAWHDPRGGHEVCLFRSADLANWEEMTVLHVPEKRLWNTSVCYGDGRYIMAIEVRGEEGYPNPYIGVDFTTFFAQSTDLVHWEMLPDEYSYTPARYNACPVLRYTAGYYYMICLEALPCARYAPYIYRSRDLFNWEVGFHNPVMMWGGRRPPCQAGCRADTGRARPARISFAAVPLPRYQRPRGPRFSAVWRMTTTRRFATAPWGCGPIPSAAKSP